MFRQAFLLNQYSFICEQLVIHTSRCIVVLSVYTIQHSIERSQTTKLQSYTMFRQAFLLNQYSFIYEQLVNSHKPLYRCIECIVRRLYNSLCLLLIIFMYLYTFFHMFLKVGLVSCYQIV